MRNDALAIVASVAASLALFACSGDREAAGGTPAEQPRTAAAATRPTAPTTPAPAAGAPTTGAPTAPAPDEKSPNAWGEQAAEASSFPIDDQTGEIAFGSDPTLEEETAPATTASAEPLPGGGHVFTNKDLQRYRPLKSAFGMDDEANGAARNPDAAGKDDMDAANAADPNKPEEGKLTPEEAQAQIEATQAEIAKAEEDLKYLRSRPASLHNPFLPRVQPKDEDAAKESGMDNVQRLEHVAARISETEARINELRQKLEVLSQPQTTPPNQ